MKVLLIGGGAREHAIGESLVDGGAGLFVVASNDNPGLQRLVGDPRRFHKHLETATDDICRWAKQQRIEIAVIGLEDPLVVGLPDALSRMGIPTVGPCLAAARIETSKLFARELMKRYGLPGQLDWHYFDSGDALAAFLNGTDRLYALKPVGLTAGKGVRVMGQDERVGTREQAIAYGRQVIAERIGDTAGILVEECITGEEFTLQVFVDGTSVVGMPLVRDYKRAYEGDEGPNTGSMGSYSQPDGLLPFVDATERDEALAIVRGVIDALRAEGIDYRGILYGQFMMTDEGIRVVEFNARFGDPEAVNVLSLLKSNLFDLCLKIVSGDLHSEDVQFERKATVCKYLAPPGYPEKPLEVPLSLDIEKIRGEGVQAFFAKVEMREGKLYTTRSRTAALVGIADSLNEAEQAVERALKHVKGDYHIRHDIGTPALLSRGVRPRSASVHSPA